jgi:cell division protein FtsW
VIPLVCLGTILLLVFVEPDFGTTFLIAVVGMLMMFIGGTRFSFLLVSGFIGLVSFFFMIMQSPERMGRMVAFTDPIKYQKDDAYQLINALFAFVLGSDLGVGLGNSLQKRFYLPEAHTDFIFAIIGEELGLPGTLSVVLLFVTFLVCGWVISLNADDVFGRLLGMGITMMITLQASINMMVVTGLLPTKGLALPFISFGGSSFVVNGMMLGILISIGLNEGREHS